MATANPTWLALLGFYLDRVGGYGPNTPRPWDSVDLPSNDTTSSTVPPPLRASKVAWWLLKRAHVEGIC